MGDFIRHPLASFRAWREYQRETEMLLSLYDMTDGHWKALAFAHRQKKKGVRLESFTQGSTGRTAAVSSLINAVPVPGFIRSAFRADRVFRHMAQSAWATSSFLEHTPAFWRDAAYDLLAITTLWARRKRAGAVLDDFTAKAEAEGTNDLLFGKALVLQFVERGISRIKKSDITEMYATNPFKNQVKKYIEPLTNEMRHAALTGVGIDEDWFETVWTEYIPVISRIWGVGKDVKKIAAFQVAAIEYYTAKKKVETIHGRPVEP